MFKVPLLVKEPDKVIFFLRLSEPLVITTGIKNTIEPKPRELSPIEIDPLVVKIFKPEPAKVTVELLRRL